MCPYGSIWEMPILTSSFAKKPYSPPEPNYTAHAILVGSKVDDSSGSYALFTPLSTRSPSQRDDRTQKLVEPESKIVLNF